MYYHDIESKIEDAIAATIKKTLAATAYIIGEDDNNDVVEGDIPIYKGICHEEYKTPYIAIAVDKYDNEIVSDYYITGNVFAELKIEVVQNMNDISRDDYRDINGDLGDTIVRQDLWNDINNSGINLIKVFENGWIPLNVERMVSESEIKKIYSCKVYCRPSR